MSKPSSQSTGIERKITRPFSKLNRLCREAGKRGGTLTTFKAVSVALDVSAGRITQMFGHGQEDIGTVLSSKTVGRLIRVFNEDGVPCEIEWLYLDYDEFAARLAAAPEAKPVSFRSIIQDAPPARWELREMPGPADLVELRLHPPRQGNEVPNSYYVDATLLFGTARRDYEPDDGSEPRTVAIALKEAQLAMGSEGWRQLRDSMIGERGNAAEHFRRVAGGADIIGPLSPACVLDGDPLDGSSLAVIVATNECDAAFEASVTALRGGFVVSEAGASGVSVNRTAILNEFIYKLCRKDEAGRAVLARATMTRRADDPDPTT
jgi:hypothetical protein